jgi:hypothetical protein
MKSVLATVVIGLLMGISLSACTGNTGSGAAGAGQPSLTDDEKHRLYAAALTAIESPLESESFKRVCEKIEIFDKQANQNENYMAFVQAHVEWALKPETAPFRTEINTREKARDYLSKHMP